MASTLSDTLTVCRASAGTGKTYTLAANYVALLLSGESYRSILAVTFTNKATQEMKDRILLFLDNIADNTGSDADAALRAVRARMIRNLSSSDDDLRKLARDCYNRMLEDYDNIHISTIDTFLMQLLNGLGQMLDDASAGAEVELDVEHLITMAVDNLLTRPIVKQSAISNHLVAYVNERLDAGKDWDIRAHLIKIAKKLYDEAVQQMDAEGLIIFDTAAILKYKASVDWRHAACVKQLRDFYALWRDWTSVSEGISGETAVDKFIKEIDEYFTGSGKEENMFRGFTESKRKQMIDEGGVAFKAKFKNPTRAEEVYSAMVHLQELCLQCQRVYYTCKFTVSLLNDMALMTALRSEIRALLVEQNTVLLAQTADKLHRAMSVGDADFILEKAGIRYRHIMLDEFQDTSILQYENFKPLIEEILANGGTVFIVGDIKQSIYRWRNGDWTIMKNLNASTPNIGCYFHDMPLRRNFRSSREVVRFNLELFQKLTSEGFGNTFAAELYDEQYGQNDLSDYYKPGNEGGYVSVSLVPYGAKSEIKTRPDARRHILSNMFAEIESRLQDGELPSDILILVRGHKDAEAIVKFFRSQAELSETLAGTQIVSCDSFHLDSSRSVQFVIQSLRRIIFNDQIAQTYLRLVFPDFDIAALDAINSATPLSELFEEIIKLLPSQPISDLAYINALLDGVHDYVAKYGSDAKAFLTYWEDKMHDQSISAPTSNAIKIMTVHSAKGLEGKNVFIPFCSWEMEKNMSEDVMWCEAKGLLKAPVEKLKYIPITMSPALANSEYEEEYAQEHLQQRLDNLNLLYVALTRARENLYVYGDVSESKIKSNETAASLLYKSFVNAWSILDNAYTLTVGKPKGKHAYSGKSGGLTDRFSFEHAQIQQAQLHVGERPVSFQMSREALDSLQFGTDSEDRNARIDLGNVCHAIMERIETQKDRDAAINDARMRGLIADDEAEKEICRLIDTAWTNIQMLDWFSGRWELLREATFLTANAELRPDRVMIDRATSTAIVLDYKFGQREPQYARQVRQYMRIMAELNFRHVEGYLWYAQEAQLQQVTL